MAHFALIDENNIVVHVSVTEDNFLDTIPVEERHKWIQTSYNTYGGQHPEGRPLRKNYAGIGYTYDRQRDAFIAPQPFSSWTLNEETCLWDPPIQYPNNDKNYTWDEETLSWKENLDIT